MMGYGLLWIGLLWVAVLLGFAYIIGILAMKETGNVKVIGQVIAGVIAVLTVIIFLYGAVWGGQMKRGMTGRGMGCPMMGSGMMGGQKGMMKMDGMKMEKEGKMMHKMMREGDRK
jgi:hypothetical protein